MERAFVSMHFLGSSYPLGLLRIRYLFKILVEFGVICKKMSVMVFTGSAIFAKAFGLAKLIPSLWRRKRENLQKVPYSNIINYIILFLALPNWTCGAITSQGLNLNINHCLPRSTSSVDVSQQFLIYKLIWTHSRGSVIPLFNGGNMI